MGWWRVGFPVPLVVCGRVCRAGVAASQLAEVVPVRHWVSDHLPGAHIIGVPARVRPVHPRLGPQLGV